MSKTVKQNKKIIQHWELPYHKLSSLPSSIDYRVTVTNQTPSCQEQIELGVAMKKKARYYFVSEGNRLTISLASMLCYIGDKQTISNMIDIVKQTQAMIMVQPYDRSVIKPLTIFASVATQPNQIGYLWVVINAFQQLLLKVRPSYRQQEQVCNQKLAIRYRLKAYYRWWADHHIQMKCYRYLKKHSQWKRIGIYQPDQWQVPTKKIIIRLLKLKRKVFISCLSDDDRIFFQHVQNQNDPAINNHNGLKITFSYSYNNKQLVNPNNMDVLVIPVTCFDRQHRSWSYQNDHYQSLLSSILKPKVGLAYREQEINHRQLPTKGSAQLTIVISN